MFAKSYENQNCTREFIVLADVKQEIIDCAVTDNLVALQAGGDQTVQGIKDLLTILALSDARNRPIKFS